MKLEAPLRIMLRVTILLPRSLSFQNFYEFFGTYITFIKINQNEAADYPLQFRSL